MPVATPMPKKLNGFRGDARVYHLSEPLDGAEYVVVSAVVVPYSGPETYIFPADENGEIVDYGRAGRLLPRRPRPRTGARTGRLRGAVVTIPELAAAERERARQQATRHAQKHNRGQVRDDRP